MEKPNFYFKSFIEDKNIYNLCQGFWNKTLKKSLSKYNLQNIDDNISGYIIPNLYANGTKIYDGNPILCYVDLYLRRSIRIITIPESEYDSEEYDINYQLTVWTESKDYYLEGNDEAINVTELVLSLFMTKFSMLNAPMLIDSWLNPGNDNFMKNSNINRSSDKTKDSLLSD